MGESQYLGVWYDVRKTDAIVTIGKSVEELMYGWFDVDKSSCGNIRRFNSHHIALSSVVVASEAWKHIEDKYDR